MKVGVSKAETRHKQLVSEARCQADHKVSQGGAQRILLCTPAQVPSRKGR